MADGKIRHHNHITDSKAIQFLQNYFPSEWVCRQMHPDYGIDIDLELFAYEGDECVTLGEHVFLQVKGTENAQYVRIKPFGEKLDGNASKSDIDVVKFSIDVSLLRLVERMGSSIPVLLVVVDLVMQQAYQVCLNDYIRYVLPEQNPKFREQKNITVYIPTENKISNQIFMWYGKRAKMYALFQEINAVADDCIYAEGVELIGKIRQLLNRIQNHDAWNARKYFGFMYFQYNLLTEMCDHDLVTEESKKIVQLSAKDSDNWENATLYVGIAEVPTIGYVFAQELSCKRFLELASAMSSYYEGVLRHIWLPTTTNQLFAQYSD